jgi:hypothetical protein
LPTAAALLFPSVVLAQGREGDICGRIRCQASFQLQLFEPELGDDHLITVPGPNTLRHLNFDAQAMFHYAHKPLSFFTADDGSLEESAVNVIENQAQVDVMAALGLINRVQVGLAVPFVISESGDFFDRRENAGDGEAPTSGLGDLRLSAKARVMGTGSRGLGVAFAPVVTVPTGGDGADKNNFTGERKPTVRLRGVGGWRDERIAASAYLGYLIRENTTYIQADRGAIVVADQILYGGGGAFRAATQVELIGEVFGRLGASNPADLDASPAEIDVGVRVEPAPRKLTGFFVTGGGGAGIHKGMGSPVARGFVGLKWAPDFNDADGDGLYDRFDQCIDGAEDRDGFDDADGCPDPDNDQDLAPDVSDKCPLQAEDRDQFEDEDGCPDPDNDGDKIADIQDECPFVAGSVEFKGCTAETYDSDGDGIKDAGDKCKDDAEDPDGYQDEDGCPDPDNDGDGVPDNFDDCPDKAEDADGYKDEDGCPDEDNDADGVPDASDKCPMVPGAKTKEGCP